MSNTKKSLAMPHKAEASTQAFVRISRAIRHGVYALCLTSLFSVNTIAQERIVSTSLCGDSYVLSMLEQSHIAALSWQSNDPLSNAPQDMRTLPKAWDDAERLLALRPTLVIFGAGEGRIAKPLLDKAGIAHVNIIWGESFDEVNTNTQALSKVLRVPYVRDQHAHDPLQDTNPKPSVLYLSSAGGTAGTGTYVDAAITQAGGRNIISRAGWYTPDPESIAALAPDLIITSFFKDGYASVNQAGLRNKILQTKIETTPSVNIPGKLWSCAGPGLFEATALIASAIGTLE